MERLEAASRPPYSSFLIHLLPLLTTLHPLDPHPPSRSAYLSLIPILRGIRLVRHGRVERVLGYDRCGLALAGVEVLEVY